jgi:hypothetical protein
VAAWSTLAALAGLSALPTLAAVVARRALATLRPLALLRRRLRARALLVFLVAFAALAGVDPVRRRGPVLRLAVRAAVAARRWPVRAIRLRLVGARGLPLLGPLALLGRRRTCRRGVVVGG